MGLDRFDTDKPDTDDYPEPEEEGPKEIDATSFVDVHISGTQKMECGPDEFDEVLEELMEMAEVIEKDAREALQDSPAEVQTEVPEYIIKDILSDEFARTFEHYP